MHRFYANMSFIQWSWTTANFALPREFTPVFQIQSDKRMYVYLHTLTNVNPYILHYIYGLYNICIYIKWTIPNISIISLSCRKWSSWKFLITCCRTSLALGTNFGFDFTVFPNACSKMSLSDKFHYLVSISLYFVSVLSVLWTNSHHFWLACMDFLTINQSLQYN